MNGSWMDCLFEWFGLKGSISNEHFMIHDLKNLPMEYDVILDGLDNHLTSSCNDAFMIEIVIMNKLRLKTKKRKKKKMPWEPIGKNTKAGAISVANMAINILTENVLIIKTKEKNGNEKKESKSKKEKFNCVCFHCGKKEHRIKNCDKRNQTQQGIKRILCNG